MDDLISLEEVKLHCRIDDDYEDTLLLGYIAASLEVCQQHIGKRFSDDLEFNQAIKVGCLMYVAFLYENRSAISDFEKSEVPMAISSLWGAYRDLGVY